MKERPILFSAPMVQAILDGRKTMTRRVVKHMVGFGEPDAWCHRAGAPEFFEIVGDYRQYCPHGQPGDRLWVRETFSECPADFKDTGGVIYRADGKYNEYVLPGEWRPSIFMPRKHCRIILEITAVRIERLQDITELEATHEGIVKRLGVHCRDDFRFLWESINEKRGYGWDSNPWVWVIEFKIL